jgi:hypothetical protein
MELVAAFVNNEGLKHLVLVFGLDASEWFEAVFIHLQVDVGLGHV